jgi:hypothetical protein
MPTKPDQKSSAGLCSTCAHSAVIESSKGSAFLLCRLSKTDPRFPKYPRVPVLACEGFRPESPASATHESTGHK